MSLFCCISCRIGRRHWQAYLASHFVTLPTILKASGSKIQIGKFNATPARSLSAPLERSDSEGRIGPIELLSASGLLSSSESTSDTSSGQSPVAGSNLGKYIFDIDFLSGSSSPIDLSPTIWISCPRRSDGRLIIGVADKPPKMGISRISICMGIPLPCFALFDSDVFFQRSLL